MLCIIYVVLQWISFSFCKLATLYPLTNLALHSLSSPWQSLFCQSPWILPLWFLPISGIIQHLSFYESLISLSTMFSRFTHVITWVTISFLFFPSCGGDWTKGVVHAGKGCSTEWNSGPGISMLVEIELCSIVCICHILFIFPSADGHLGCVHLLAIVTDIIVYNGCTNICLSPCLQCLQVLP